MITEKGLAREPMLQHVQRCCGMFSQFLKLFTRLEVEKAVRETRANWNRRSPLVSYLSMP